MTSPSALAPPVESHTPTVEAFASLAPVSRVASLLPGLTDVLQDLGLSTSVVATSHECSPPMHAVTSPKLPSSSLCAAEIAAGWNAVSFLHPLRDARVQHLSTRVCSFYAVNMRRLAESHPHLLLTHIAKPCTPDEPSEDDVVAALKRLIPGLCHVVSVHCQTLADVFRLHHRVADIMRCPGRAVEAVAQARTKLRSLEARAVRRSCAVVQWTEPLYLAGDWVPGVVKMVAENDGVTVEGGPSVCVEVQQLEKMDVVIFAICAVRLEGCKRIVNAFLKKHALTLKCAFVVDGDRLFARPALSVVVQSAEVIADMLRGGSRYRGVLWDEWET